MSTLEALFSTEKAVLSFIQTNSDVSDFILKREYHSIQTSDNSPELYEVIDNLIYEGRIQRIYREDSQVPLYQSCEK